MKSLTRLGMLCGVVVALVCLSGVLAVANGGGATVITEFGCGIIPADWGGPFALFTTDTHSVTTPSGNSKITCNFVVPDDEIPDKARIFRDFACSTFAGLADKSQSVVDTEGNIVLLCQVKPDDSP
ncbi:MAG: hypothetical protein ACYST5_06840 [Planctomycetota bacterium]